MTGWRDAVKFGSPEKGDLADRVRLDAVFTKWQPVAVMHFAALSLVGESLTTPGKYWSHNVLSSLNLIEASCAAARRRKRIFVSPHTPNIIRPGSQKAIHVSC